MPLVIDSNSTCDVCLEGYSCTNMPYAIPCGHVFCQKCLDWLAQRKCPLCRQEFAACDVRKLHVSLGVRPQVDHVPSRDDSRHLCESRRLLDEIARIVERGDVDGVQRVIGECTAYYESQPGNQYTTPVRVSCLLLHNLLEAQNELNAQAERIRETTAVGDEICVRLTSELEAIKLKCENLERTSRDDKEAALSVEKGLRELYDQMNRFWKSQVESVNPDYRSLREELDRLGSTQIRRWFAEVKTYLQSRRGCRTLVEENGRAVPRRLAETTG